MLLKPIATDLKRALLHPYRITPLVTPCASATAANAAAAAEMCTEVIAFPPFPFINAVEDILSEVGVSVGAQSVYFEDKGAYTGAVASSMVQV